MAKANLTKSANINVAAREIDFVTRFGESWQALIDVMGISRPIRKPAGAVLKSKEGKVVLQNSVGEGEEIPYSLATVNEKLYEEITLEKYAKAVSAESIKDHGYDTAVALTDNAFRKSLQNKVLDKYFNFIQTGTLTNVETGFQKALAYARGLVVDAWGKMNLDMTGVVGFANVLDYSDYIGSANITTQNLEGIQYIKDFMNYNVIFLLDSAKIPQGTVIATPVENIIMYYVDASDSDFARADLVYTTDGVLNLIGYHTQGNYSTAVSESFALMGITMMAEYLNGIAVVTIDTASSTLGTLTTSSTAGTTSGKTVFAVTTPLVGGGKLYYKTAASTAPAVTYKGSLDSTWTEVAGEVTATNGHKYTIAEVNGTGQVIASGTGTVVSAT